MPIYQFNESGTPINQRPIYIATAGGAPVPIQYVYEFDASGTPRMVYGSGPEWLARYKTSTVAEFNTEYITGIDGAEIGEYKLHINNGEPFGRSVWGINFSLGFGDTSGDQGNYRDDTKIFRIIPSTINLYGATAISLVGTGFVNASVHGHIDTETYCYFGFGGVDTEVFQIKGFALDGDEWGHSEQAIRTTFPISPINGQQEMYFKIRHLQRSPQASSNSFGLLCLQQINVLYT